MFVLETKNLTKVYPTGGGCFDITLAVEQGEVFGLLGPNGAGKSTFVKMLVGLLRPTGGEGRLLGLPLRLPAARRQVGYLPENFRYHDWMSARELLEFHGALHGLDHREIRTRIPEVLSMVNLRGVEGRLVRTFSKGMQQRLGLAVALLTGPRLLFLDEPTSALDPIGRKEIRETILQLRGRGVAVFLNSHLLTEVERVCGRVAVINKGRIRAQGSLEALLGAGLEVEMHVGGVTAALMERLAKQGTVTRSERDEQRDIQKIWVRVASKEQIPVLAESVVNSGNKLYLFSPKRSTLEELFVELVAGDDHGV
ncbi:MAG: ABC transporter ATP-binding protein [Bacillota bacterium]